MVKKNDSSKIWTCTIARTWKKEDFIEIHWNDVFVVEDFGCNKCSMGDYWNSLIFKIRRNFTFDYLFYEG
jgi:hypothetical protein